MNRSIRLRLFLALAALTALLTGCPRNEYIVDLKPQGNALERTLTFYREELGQSNEFLHYELFPTEEQASINLLYPDSGIKRDGDRHIDRGLFTNAMPNDVGGVGHYTNFSTSLGNAGFYVERFRGNDDIAGITEKRVKAANELADMALGWSKLELGSQPGYEQLRQFLDVDFRRDLQNAGAYWWQGQFAETCRTNASEEFFVRFGQYLVERGYLQIGEMPALFSDATDSDGGRLNLLIRRVVARKMGVPDSQPVPAALSFLENDDAIDKSFKNYLTNTEPYRARFKKWDEDRKSNSALQEPDPAGEAMKNLIDFNLFGGSNDRLTVQLSIPLAPIHSNGRWDDATKQVIWEAALDDRTNLTHLPVFCYANWAIADAGFQNAHLGKVALVGDQLTEYCVWRSSLDDKQAAEWDAMLTALRPGEHLTKTLASFRFSGESAQTGTSNQSAGSSSFARELLIDGLK